MRNVSKFDREDGPLYNLWTASIFFFGMIFAWLAETTAKTAEKKALSRVLLWCDGISCMTYVLISFRLTPALASISGRPVDVGRFLEWVATCPVLILLIGEVTKTQSLSLVIVKYDYIMLVCGFLASISRDPFSNIFVCFSVGCFFKVIDGLYVMFQQAIDGKTGSKLGPLSLTYARNVTCFAWTCFPVVWFSNHYQLISFGTMELAYGLADILAKVVLTLILVNATVEQAQNEKV
jgi:bacteriorhodopsin